LSSIATIDQEKTFRSRANPGINVPTRRSPGNVKSGAIEATGESRMRCGKSLSEN